MMFLLNCSGQTGNRFRSLSSLIALGIELGQNVVCPVVQKELIENIKLEQDRSIKIKFYYNSIWYLAAKIISKISFIKDEISLFGGKIIIFTDWLSFARPELLEKYYTKIKNYFDFKEEFKEICEKKLPLKKYGEELVAVHLRRGDYKNWHNGEYYYSIDKYIKQLTTLYEENRNISFVIFSNEVIDSSLFNNLPYNVTFMKGTAQEDLCCMSLCDYIIGPPSTYSAWAGYIGNKKLIWMKERDRIYKFSEFENVPNSMATTKNFW